MTDQLVKRRRRFFRFRLRTLLALPVLFAAGWWWVMWPERTAARFVGLLAAGDVETAQTMSEPQRLSYAFWKVLGSKSIRIQQPTLAAPSWVERLKGERRFVVPWKSGAALGDFREFKASLGRVTLSSAIGENVAMTYVVHNVVASDMTSILSALYCTPEYSFSFDNNQNCVIIEASHSSLKKVCDLIEELDKANDLESKRQLHFVSPASVDKIMLELQKVPQPQRPQ